MDENVIVVGRSEGFLVGNTNIGETIERLAAYANAGADVLYAPGVSSDSDIKAIVEAVAPKAVNILLVSPDMTGAALQKLGVRRISAGGFLAMAAWNGFESGGAIVCRKRQTARGELLNQSDRAMRKLHCAVLQSDRDEQ